MIEVNLFSVPTSDVDAKYGKNVARARFDIEAMNVGIFEFVKGFLSDNMDNLEGSIGNADLVQFINGNDTMTATDYATLKYLLKKLGYLLTIWNVADDEENAQGIGTGIVEYNIVNHNFLQHDFPTTTKLNSSGDKNLADMLQDIIDQSGLFDPEKFSGVKNPFTGLLNSLNQEKENLGGINTTIATQIYNLLSQMGFEIFCSTSEE